MATSTDCPCGEPVGSMLHRALADGSVWCSRCGGILLPGDDALTWQAVTFHRDVAGFLQDPSAERLERILRAVAFCEHASAKRRAFRWCTECGASEHAGLWLPSVTAAVLRSFIERYDAANVPLRAAVGGK